VAYGREDAAATPDNGAPIGGPAAEAAPVPIPVEAEQGRVPATAGIPVAAAAAPATAVPQPPDAPPRPAPPRRWRWAELLRRVFAVDVLACPSCGGRMRVIATIDDPEVVQRILTHLDLAAGEEALGPWPQRAP
jgi:hypothetical protein